MCLGKQSHRKVLEGVGVSDYYGMFWGYDSVGTCSKLRDTNGSPVRLLFFLRFKSKWKVVRHQGKNKFP